MRILDGQDFPPDQIRLIARKQQGHDTPDLSTSAYDLYELLKEQSTSSTVLNWFLRCDLLGERGSCREKGLRKFGRNLALPIGHGSFLELGTVELVSFAKLSTPIAFALGVPPVPPVPPVPTSAALERR